MEYFSSANYIQAIADARNISAAAEKMGISQPALSSHLKKLEENLGVILFDRTKQPLALTDAGRIYLEYSARYQAMQHEFQQQLSDIEEMRTGRLIIAGASSFNVSYFPEAVAKFTHLYPGIEFEIIDDNIPEISVKAATGQIDLFIAPPGKQDERLQYESLLKENIFLCVPAQWEINERLKDFEIPVGQIMQSAGTLYQQGVQLPQVDFKEFRDMPFVLLKEDQHIGRTMDSLFSRHGFRPDKVTVAEQTMTSYNLTIAGIGISLMTESTIKNSNFRTHPKLYMADSDLCMREMFVAYPKNKYLSRAAREFIRILKDSLGMEKCG